jgi:hypothetical protein
MEPIHVPGPPKQAFNKNRPISDLIRAQVKHLKHVEASLPPDQRTAIPQHEITTESEAAQYIASMTNLFQSQATTSPVPIKPAAPVITKPAAPVVITKPAAPISTKPALSIAASAPATKKKAAPKKTKAPAAKSAKPKRKK